MYYNITLYTLNLHDVLYQLYLSKAGNNKLEGLFVFFQNNVSQGTLFCCQVE